MYGGESWPGYGESIFYPAMYALAISSDDAPLLVSGSYGSGAYWIYPPAPTNIYLPLVASHFVDNQ